MHFRYIIILLILAIGIISGCSNQNNDNAEETKPTIYTTVYPLQFLVQEIAGEEVDAVSVYPSGVDEHTYEPTSRELTSIADGEAFFYIGAGLEAFANTAASALENQDVRLIEIGANEELFLNNEHDHDHENEEDDHHHGDLDPHIWLDPLRMIDIAEIIYDELTDLFPDNQVLFEENLVNLTTELGTLDEEFQLLISSKSNKKILVSHAAFGYWEERYQLEQLSIHGLSTENEPSQKDLIEIVDLANENEIKHIIFEQNVVTRISEVIQQEIDAEVRTLHNLSVLTEDDKTEERDYFSIMRDNLNVLDEVLGE
ncbi:metal ABC transporter solute-binding protein, Zn/Mn family [Oceanobacillus sp. CAU 1775]